jgi:dihydroorotate dehydrogenase (NAD+) catalytic subunit
MEFLVTGATAVQIGTANFYHPTASIDILDALPAALAELGAKTVAEVVGTLQTPASQAVPACQASPASSTCNARSSVSNP